MHVCVLTRELDPFKGGTHLPLLSSLKNVSFTIITNKVKRSVELPSNIKVLELNTRLGPYEYGFADSRFAKALLKKYPPSHNLWKSFNLIHLNQVNGPALLKLKETGKPILYLVHHPVTCDEEVAVNESGFLNGIKWRLKYFMLKKWQKKLCAGSSHVATVSQAVSERIQKNYKCDESKISIVPNGVDGEVFVLGMCEKKFDVVAIGSFIHPRKGFKYLFDVYQKLSAKGYRIADIGRRSESQQKLLGNVDGVESFGTVDASELISVLRSSSVLISTSLYEGFGLSLIEALSCGIPVFAFDVGAVSEVLEAIDTSLVIPSRDVEEMVRRVEGFLSLTQEEKDERGRKFRDDVLGRYSIQKAADALRKVYEKVAFSAQSIDSI